MLQLWKSSCLSEHVLGKCGPLRSSRSLIRVAVVGDRNSYALQLTRALASLPNVKCLFYGPKKPPSGRVIQFSGFNNDKAVWTTYSYVLQIPAQVLRDRPHIIHFDFTLTTFGNTYLSCLPLVPLVILLRLLAYKVVITVHDTITKQILGELFGTRTIRKHSVWITSVAFYKFLSLANILIVHLEIQKQMLATMCYIDPKKMFVVPFGVAAVPSIPDVKLNLWKQKFRNTKVVLFFGNIAPRKGIEYLIEGFSLIADKHPDSCLVIGGGADSRNKSYLNDLLKRANQIDNKSFAYLGYLKENDAHSLLKLSRVVVLPYVYAHASPSILYWAIQHHKPVIASKIGTLYEELEGYLETLLVRPHDSEQIAMALDEILTHDNLVVEATHFMASKASSISWSRTREDVHKIYLSLV